MKITETKLRNLIRKSILLKEEEEKQDEDFDPNEIQGVPIPQNMKKMLDPNVDPKVYAQMDSMLDEKGTPDQQAIALSAFALSYADWDEKATLTLLKKSLALIPKLVKSRKSEEK